MDNQHGENISCMKWVMASIIVTLCQFAFGSPTFGEANKLYEQGNYQKARQAYEDILKEQPRAAEVYYNLGNCYFRQNELAKAILNYERTLKINPEFELAKENLNIANARKVDKVDAVDRQNMSSFWENKLRNLGARKLGMVSVISFALLGIMGFIFLTAKMGGIKKVAFSLSLISLLTGGVSLFLAVKTNQLAQSAQYGIVMVGKADVLTEPTSQARIAFVLHEGTKVKVEQNQSEWAEIALSNGTRGWIKAKTIEMI